MSSSSLCDYSDPYVLVKGTITVANNASESAANNAANEKVIFKNFVPFTNFICRINNAQVENVHDIDVVMPMHNLIEYCINYSVINFMTIL